MAAVLTGLATAAVNLVIDPVTVPSRAAQARRQDFSTAIRTAKGRVTVLSQLEDLLLQMIGCSSSLKSVQGVEF